MKWELLVPFFLIFSVMIAGCFDIKKTEETVPAFRVSFMHYVVNETHIIRINDVEKVNVSPSEIKMYGQPPFPGIHIFSIYSRGISDSAYVPLNEEGDNITVFFTYNPEKLPTSGEKVMLVIEARDASGRTLARDKTIVEW